MMKPNKYILAGITLSTLLVTTSGAHAQKKVASKRKVKASAVRPVGDTTQAQALVLQIEKAYRERDDLQARVLIKKMSALPKSFKQWWAVRQILLDRPQIGFDYATKWDRLRPPDEAVSLVENQVNLMIQKADQLQLQDKFEDAFRLYQSVAKHLKKDARSGSQRFLYWTVVHNMARSLYGAGRLSESLEVYEWIPPDYYKFRQVLFEKMWAGFRAKRYDRALGAIASQQSSYFASALEPETYLIQLYLFKKLCRMDEHKRTLQNIERIMKRLDGKDGTYSLDEWAQSDVETKVLYRLANVPVAQDGQRTAKLAEQEAIQKALNTRFQLERKRLQSQFKTVLAYSRLSVALDKEIIVTDVVPDREALMRSRKEFWPVEDAEDWIDELGQHLYIGESKCGKSAK